MNLQAGRICFLRAFIIKSLAVYKHEGGIFISVRVFSDLNLQGPRKINANVKLDKNRNVYFHF